MLDRRLDGEELRDPLPFSNFKKILFLRWHEDFFGTQIVIFLVLISLSGNLI